MVVQGVWDLLECGGRLQEALNRGQAPGPSLPPAVFSPAALVVLPVCQRASGHELCGVNPRVIGVL